MSADNDGFPCPHCGETLAPKAKFCRECGASDDFGWEEYDALDGHPDRAITLLAAVRLLASPVVERRVNELARRSLAWVVDGVMPKKFASKS